MIKICGATTPDDLRLLGACGVDLVGLWHGIPGGHAELTLSQLARLTAAARAGGTPEPVLVTFANDPRTILDLVARTGVRWIQLHAYQLPAVVGDLKPAAPNLTVVKVLHVQGGRCVERRLVKAYERAGVDYFLLDATTARGQVGSTGQRLATATVLDVADGLERPFLLAGGISAANRGEYDDVVAHPGFVGVDVDTGARDSAGRLRPERILAIRRRWQATVPERVSA